MGKLMFRALNYQKENIFWGKREKIDIFQNFGLWTCQNIWLLLPINFVRKIEIIYCFICWSLENQLLSDFLISIGVNPWEKEVGCPFQLNFKILICWRMERGHFTDYKKNWLGIKVFPSWSKFLQQVRKFF